MHFVKHFVSIPDFLELQCLVDDLVYFLEVSISMLLYLEYYLIKWKRDLDMKKSIVVDTINIIF